jgi:CubicO group peptidase (beta-lactamase class C family)
MMRQTVLVFAMVAAVSVTAAAGQAQSVTRLDGSTITATEIDATVTRLMKAAEVPGVGIAIFDGGKIAYLKAYGERDKERNLPLTVNSGCTPHRFLK